MPTLVIADADGTELAKSVGAPFSTPDGAIKWFDDIGPKITTYKDMSAKWDESKHTNAEAGEKLAEAANAIGQKQKAIEVFEALIALAGDDKARAAALHLKIARMLLDDWDTDGAATHLEKADKLTPAEGDARVDLDVVRARALLFSERGEAARKLADKYYKTLFDKADARAIDLAEVLMATEQKEDEAAFHKKGREMYLALAKAFAKHERVWELKVYAAWYGMSGDDKEAAKKEMAEVAEKGEGRWKDIAKSIIEEGNEEDSEEGDAEPEEDEMG